jgi:hypothetical protein
LIVVDRDEEPGLHSGTERDPHTGELGIHPIERRELSIEGNDLCCQELLDELELR